MKLKGVYQQLTNVNIEDQKRIWDERGKGYYGEYLVFCELYKNVIGNCKILMNLNVPTLDGKTTEIDLLLIHETGIYVFEVKHYKGTIYGNTTDEVWTQYFRTTQNRIFKNPMLQNEYHIKAISSLIPNVPIKSVIVFTSSACDLRVNNYNENVELCKLKDLNWILEKDFFGEYKYSREEIDAIFEMFSKYSPMQDLVLCEGEEKPFIYWLQPVIAELEQEKNNFFNTTIQLKKDKFKIIFLGILVMAACIIFTNFSIKTTKKLYNYELNSFKQNFKHVDEIGNEYIDALNEFVDVSNISLNQVVSNVVSFSARISMSNDIYGIALNENSRYIVMTDSGMVFEYDVFGEHLKYYRYSNMIGKGIRLYGDLTQAQFYGVNKSDITYIKITNIELFKLGVQRTTIKDNLEIELYSLY